MPKMSQHTESSLIKMMLIGDSGTGKTGALFSLLEAGYNLKILDFDNGVDIISKVARDHGKTELLDQAEYVTLTDKWKAVGARMIPAGQPKAWSNALKLLSTGKLGEEDWGNPDEWGDKDILVVDSLTMAAKSAMLNVLQVNGRLMDNPQIQDWGEAQRIVGGLIQMLCSTELKCNVIVLSHINYIELEGIAKGYPTAVGKALSTELPRYFNIILQCRTKGTGQNAKRIISAVPAGMVETKAGMMPKNIPESWSQDKGLAEFFDLYKKGK